MQASVGDVTWAFPMRTPTVSTAGGATPVSAGSRPIVVVHGTGGAGARLRSQPGNDGQIIMVVPELTPLVVVGDDRQADGLTWRNVLAPNGAVGWVAATFVTPGP